MILLSTCETCDLPIALDEAGWSDIWFRNEEMVLGPGGYTCSATAFRKPHVPSVEAMRQHLVEITRELSA